MLIKILTLTETIMKNLINTLNLTYAIYDTHGLFNTR